MSTSGGTLTLPSPTHPHHHHVDAQAGLRSLRRSLSRSPSKFSLVRTTSQSSSDAGSLPSTPTIRRVQSQYFGQNTSLHSPSGSQPHTQSPLATPFRPNVRLSLRSAKSTKSPASTSTSNKPFSRHRTSPKSPSRRALNQASSSGNSIPPSTTPPSIHSVPSGQENINIFRTRSPASRSPAPRKAAERATNRHSMHLDMSGSSSQLGMSRTNDVGNTTPATSVASPLKRSDATMSLDHSLFGSPKAKRRSYGPTSAALDFSIFDHGPTSPNSELQDDSTREYGWSSSISPNVTEPLASLASQAAVRRAGSLRKSTLQQRERTSWGKRSAAQHLAQSSGEFATPQRTSWGKRQAIEQLAQSPNQTTTPNGKHRPRLSSEHFEPPPQPESPFSMASPLPNPSAHMLNQQVHQQHPLSRTMTTSSTSSSRTSDSPTNFAVEVAQKPMAAPMAPINFSKSLPIGALRPQPEKPDQGAASLSTPDYKSDRLYAGAFASTGLVSKMNRNPELAPPGGGYGAVPDTPCKKHPGSFATYPPLPMTGNAKARGRRLRHTFGVPSTPVFDLSTPNRSANLFSDQPRPVLFGGFSNHTRKGSLLSLGSDDGRSPSRLGGGSDTSNDGDLPPTPTKQCSVPRSTSKLGRLLTESPTANRCLAAPTSAVGTDAALQQDRAASCKYSPLEQTCGDGEGEENVVATDITSDLPTPAFQETPTPPSICVFQSFGQSRAKQGSFYAPTPLKVDSSIGFVKSPARVQCAKNNPVIPASPLDRLEFAEKASPRTPQGSFVPPDASRLSISNATDGLLFPATGGRNSSVPPATPTTRQESAPLFLERRAITPINGMPSQDLDEALMARFGKIEFIGKGEFSHVYKVTETPQAARLAQQGFSTPTHRTGSSSSGRVYAVKKLLLPMLGKKDRAHRTREVHVLQTLSGYDHILQLIDSWEDNNCLYIQTEYCEEGGLDTFLSFVGVKGRLDDFRIWKIMLEICKGLKHIHDAGYIHLDLKPANIFINFEGTLKIGDFGLTTVWPLEKSPDVEGDREYLAPEALRSEIGQPADVFSFGLIMLEIAANVKLPENGATWAALREGDFSEIPLLTQGTTAVARDATGMPIDDSDRSANLFADENTSHDAPRSYNFRSTTRQSGDIFGLGRKSELQHPPDFMRDPTNSNSLDVVVRSMLMPDPRLRPTTSQLLSLDGARWVASRRRAAATVFEGNWGPGDEVTAPISLDTEMTDV
ncbi:hypothetical protein F5Y06DRAFT_133652 [Hypoxylon sp. FL0890]|nr:hypothetical protein F5Y06DRAFT_133652 [Hypoxylon sp. FL0890]